MRKRKLVSIVTALSLTGLVLTSCGGGGGGGGSSSPQDTTPPTVPENVSAKALSSSQIKLAWSKSTDNVGVSGYYIYTPDGKKIASTINLSYTVSNLSPDTEYCYYIEAYDAVGNVSNPSQQVCATTLPSNTAVRTVGLNVAPNGNIYSVSSDGTVTIYDSTGQSQLAKISLNTDGVTSSAINGNYLYITAKDGNIYVIDTQHNKVIDSFNVGDNLSDIAFSSSIAYVTDADSGIVYVLDTSDNSISNAISIGNSLYKLAVSPNGKYLYIIDKTNNSLYRVDVSSETANVLSTGTSPEDISISPDGKYIYIVNSGDNTLQVVDASTYQTVKTVSIDSKPLAVITDGKYIYVTTETGMLYKIDASSYAVAGSENIGSPVTVLAIYNNEVIGGKGGENPSVICESNSNTIQPSSSIDVTKYSVDNFAISDYSYPYGFLAFAKNDPGKLFLTTKNPANSHFKLLVLDASTYQVEKIIDTDIYAYSDFNDIFASADGKHVYIPGYTAAENGGSALTIADVNIETESSSNIHTMLVGGFNNYPYHAIMSPDGKYIYSAGSSTSTYHALFEKIYTNNDNAVGNELYGEGRSIEAMAVSPDGRYVYVLNCSYSDVNTVVIAKVDTVANSIVDSFSYSEHDMVVKSINYAGINPKDGLLYVLYQDKLLKAIDLSAKKVVKEVKLENLPKKFVFSPNGKYIFILNFSPTDGANSTITVLDTENFSIAENIPIGPDPYDIAVTPDGRKIYTTDSQGITVVSFH